MIYKIEIITVNATSGIEEVNNITSLVDTGFSVVEKLDESLDIGTIVLNNTDVSTPYNIFDIVDITIDSTLEYSFRIGGDSISVVGKNPLTYKHTLSLIEHTKILERELISGKTFTQPLSTTATRLTLWDVVQTLRNTVPLETNNLYPSTRLFGIPITLQTYLDSIESPEFTFKDITLRDALNDVAGYVDAVVRLDRDGNLIFDFYNELLNVISSEINILEKSKQRTADYYATDMTVDSLNIVSDKGIDGIEYYPAKNTYTSLRSDSYIFDFTKSFCPTQKPIYRINKVYVFQQLVVEDGVGTPTYVSGEYEIDITDRVLEQQAYKGLKVDSPTSLIDKRDEDNFYQSTTIYYDYGKKNIITKEAK